MKVEDSTMQEIYQDWDGNHYMEIRVSEEVGKLFDEYLRVRNLEFRSQRLFSIVTGEWDWLFKVEVVCYHNLMADFLNYCFQYK